MGTIASQITSLTIVYLIVYSNADQWKDQSSASLAFVRWIHRGPVNSPHKWPVTRKIFPFDDVIMYAQLAGENWMTYDITHKHTDGLVQDCSNSSALAVELLQSYTKPSIYTYTFICSCVHI